MSGTGHIVLLGDSIFDNAAYTGGEPDVVTHLRRRLRGGWQASLRAVDGAVTSGLGAQLARVPADATHLVISVGGNDALQQTDVLTMRVVTVSDALAAFARRLDPFEREYRAAIGRAAALGRHTIVCTIYNGWFEEPQATVLRVGVALFNDVILRVAADLRLDVLELRSICTSAADYANPIEPSGPGGAKIAAAIAGAVGAVEGPIAPGRLWSSGGE